MKPNGFPTIQCEMFEDDSGKLEMFNTHKYRPRAKRLNCNCTTLDIYLDRGE